MIPKNFYSTYLKNFPSSWILCLYLTAHTHMPNHSLILQVGRLGCEENSSTVGIRSQQHVLLVVCLIQHSFRNITLHLQEKKKTKTNQDNHNLHFTKTTGLVRFTTVVKHSQPQCAGRVTGKFSEDSQHQDFSMFCAQPVMSS